MRGVRGIEDLGVFRVLGQPNLNFTVDRGRRRATRSTSPTCRMPSRPPWAATPLTQVLQGEARYDLVLRYLPQYRDTKEAIENIRLLSPTGERVSLAQLCKIEVTGRRFGNLSRRQPALHRHQVQRARPRPGQRRGGSHRQGERAGQTAARAITSTGRANTRARSAPTSGC